MNKDRHVTKADMKKAIEIDSLDLLSENDEQSFIEKMSEDFDKRYGTDPPTSSNPQRTKVTPKRKMRKTYRMALTVACCAALVALGVTGGLMNNLKTNTQDTAINTQQSQTDTTTNDTGVAVEETKPYVTESTIELGGQSADQVARGEIQLSGGQKKKNYTNPTQIKLVNANIKSGTCGWSIENYNNQKEIYTGTGTTITTQLKNMIKDKNDGSYIVLYKYVDNEGNKIQIHEVFVINTAKSDKQDNVEQ